jgi:hypothetical protein
VPYVAFYAAINGGHHGVENGKTINFDDVETNLGNEYNSSTGVFIARTPGIYVFYINLLAQRQNTIESTVFRNGFPIQHVYAGTLENEYRSGGNMVVIMLHKRITYTLKLTKTLVEMLQ